MSGRSEYKTWNKKVKEVMDKSKMRVDEEFDRKLSKNFTDSRELTQKTILEGEESERGVGLRRGRDFKMLVSS